LRSAIRELEFGTRINARFWTSHSKQNHAPYDADFMKVKNVVVAVFVLVASTLAALAQGTAFTYQGLLSSGGVAAEGSFDLRFGLYTNVSTGNVIGSLETNTAVGVTNGLFTTTLNFSNAFNGSNYWVEIGVRTNGSTGTFITLSPRQPITPTPYAITASNLTGTLPATQLTGTLPATVVSGTFSNSVSFTNATNVFVGNGSGLTNVPGVTSTNLLYGYDSTAQYVTSAGSFQNITFNTTSVNGWFVPLSGEFVAEQSGVYLVEYQAHFGNGSGSSVAAGMIRAILNLTSTPVEIASSEAFVDISPGFVVPVSRSFLITMTAGQMLSFQMTSSTAGTSGGYLIASQYAGQSFPSVSVTIVRIQ
jgi:hypothetical protein